MEKFYSEADVLELGDYRVERRLREGENAEADNEEITLSWRGTVVRRFANTGDPISFRRANHFGVAPLLGHDSKVLVIEQHSGGAHCCWSYRLYNLVDRPVLVYDTDEWLVGYPLGAMDLDGDGVFELDQTLLTFDYVHCAHAFSAFPHAIFKYDSSTRRYGPANRTFSADAFLGVQEQEKELADFKRDHQPPLDDVDQTIYGCAVLKVLVSYLYAGKLAEGWRYFDREYELPDKAAFRSEIERHLVRDRVYRAIGGK